MRCVRPLPDALQTAGQARRNFEAPKQILCKYRMNGVYRHIQYFTVIPSTSGFSEWSLSLNYPRQNLATCLPSPKSATRPNIACGTQIMIRPHNQTQPSSPCCIRRCQVASNCGVHPLPRCSVRCRRQLAASPIISFSPPITPQSKPNTSCFHL